MISTALRLLPGLLAMALVFPAFGQKDALELDERYGWERPRRAAEPPREGFWPTERMIDLMLDRLVLDEMADQYDLDQDQIVLTRELLGETIPRWMNENRAEIMHAVNYFFEAQMADEPPSPDEVAMWSRRVVPLMDDFREVIGEVTLGMGEFLDDDQFARLETEMAGFEAGMNLMTGRVRNWAEGNYDPVVDWSPPGAERRMEERMREEEMRIAVESAKASHRGEVYAGDSQATPSNPANPASGERVARRPTSNQSDDSRPEPEDEWDRYVSKFIRDLELNHEQVQKARAHLAAAKRSKANYLRSNRERSQRITDRLNRKAGPDDDAEQRAKIEQESKIALEEYKQFIAPVDEMFERLKNNLERLPTRAQWRKFEERNKKDE